MLTGRDEQALDEVATAIRGKGRKAAVSVLDLRDADRAQGAGRGGQARIRRPRYPGQQCRHHQARRFLRADRRRLGGRLCAEVLRPCAAGARGLAAAEGAPRLAGRDRRNQRQEAGEAIHHRQLGQCRRRRLHQMPRRPRQAGRRAGQLRPSEPGRDRAAMAAHPRRGRADRRDRKPRSASSSAARGISRATARSRTWPISMTFIVSSRATWMHGATIDLDGGEIPVL